MKKRISLTLDSRILESVDRTIDGVSIRNRSHAIERIIEASMMINQSKSAVLLAGGPEVSLNGKRLPKCMIPINGVPIMQHIILELKRNAVRNIIVALQDKGDDRIVEEYFKDGAAFGVKINYAYEKRPLGTFGAVHNAFSGMVPTEPFFVLNADQFFRMDMESMYEQHIQTGATATISLIVSETSVKRTSATRMEGIRNLEFGKLGKHGIGLASTGSYVFSPKVFDYFRVNDLSIEYDLFPKLISRRELYGFMYPGPWYSIDNEKIRDSIKIISEIVNGTAGIK